MISLNNLFRKKHFYLTFKLFLFSTPKNKQHLFNRLLTVVNNGFVINTHTHTHTHTILFVLLNVKMYNYNRCIIT